MRVLWTSPHCRPDWLEWLGQESQGGQTVVMNKLPHALTRIEPTLSIDIFTRLQDDDPKAGELVKDLDGNPRVRLIRLPCGPTDRYVPKEQLYGKHIDEFVDAIASFAGREGLTYDLLHGHYADGWEAVTKLKSLWHLPTLLTTHSIGKRKLDDSLKRGEGTREELDVKYNFSTRILSEEQALRAADHILPLSTLEAEYLREHYASVLSGDGRVKVIPNGIEPTEFPFPPPESRAQIRTELGVGDHEFLLLLPSRIDPRKGQKNALRALASALPLIHQQGKAIKLLLLTWPETPTAYSTELEEIMAREHLHDHVLLRPFVRHDMMPAYFMAADGVILPSQEYFSIVMLETMLLERPVISSTESGGRDAIRDGVSGFLVDHTDISRLARTIVKLVSLDKEEHRAMGEQAGDTIRTTYSWEKVAGKLLGIYNESILARPESWGLSLVHDCLS